MKIGDLVHAKYDLERGLWCVGIVTDIDNSQNFNIKVHWCDDQSGADGHYGWWQEQRLQKIE